ncbi:MAG: ABC transporter ATP-binding protein [Acidobacteriota bacterium]|nr:ABC transporter ATP-binding protein [Acidobacteriota bacterium]MDH3784520.1 ABC transporter ATP-binding protein [Acidobacteriota bacterium]
MTQNIIEFDGLGVRFGRHEILRDLHGKLAGRAIGLLGPNGAGKTTLIHTIMGFHPPTNGTARVLGLDIRTENRRLKSRIGYMPERDAFVAGMTAVRLVRLMAELSGLGPRAALERAHEALYYVGLGEARYRKLESYSLGMKQMAKLAQAIVASPSLIILDEPTNGLDPPHRERMLRLIKEIKKDGDVRVILSSHLLRDVEEVCDEVMILKDGRIASTCDLEEERRANRKFIEIETSGNDESFGAALEEMGCEIAVLSRNRIKTVLPTGVEIRDLYEIAAQREIQIRRLDFKRNSLQDIFLKAMGASSGGL